LPAAGTTNIARLIFSDNENVWQTNEWHFVITYKTVSIANRQNGPGLKSGFIVRVVQAPAPSDLDNSLQRAEAQLAANSTIPKWVDITTNDLVINYSQDGPGSADGYFPNDNAVPGLDPAVNGTDDFAVEMLTYLQLPAGVTRFGVRCDDGYEIKAGNSPSDPNASLIAFHNGGPADETFDLVVPQAGFYPFHMIWYERGGGAHAEWFTVDPTDPTKRTLINDPAVATSLKAWQQVVVPTIALYSAAEAAGPYKLETGPILGNNTLTLPYKADAKQFYRVKADSALKLQIQIQGANVIIKF